MSSYTVVAAAATAAIASCIYSAASCNCYRCTETVTAYVALLLMRFCCCKQRMNKRGSLYQPNVFFCCWYFNATASVLDLDSPKETGSSISG
jgi:hypothetical protein